MKTVWLLLLATVSSPAQTSPLDYLNHNRPVLDAHNCYPYEGKWADRIDRALETGFPVGIEQDVAWHVDRATRKGTPVVSHTANTKGTEPTLRKYFFERVRPIVEKALVDNDRARWPLIVLHFDFKDNRPELLQAVWDLLGEYEGWITTAENTADPNVLAPFNPKPLLVLTEDSDDQEEFFFKRVPIGAKLRVFGSARTRGIAAPERAEREHLLATLPPEQMLTTPPTNYRRWWNNSWHAVEEGGQQQAGAWTPADEARLRALVDHAHKLGYWIRFYTLDGLGRDESKGWDESYNFGSRDAAAIRWKAAKAAGVNLIATDQYEEASAVLR
jgi:hypothetical protein